MYPMISFIFISGYVVCGSIWVKVVPYDMINDIYINILNSISNLLLFVRHGTTG